MSKRLSIVAKGSFVGSEPKISRFILQNAPNCILCGWAQRFRRSQNGNDFGTGAVQSRRIVAGDTVSRAEPKFAVFVFIHGPNIITAQAVFLCKIGKRFPIVAINPFSRGTEPK